MSERTCNGDAFRVGDELYWICRWDGTLTVGIGLIKSAECPTCKRPANPKFWGEVPTITKRIVQAVLPNGRHVVIECE